MDQQNELPLEATDPKKENPLVRVLRGTCSRIHSSRVWKEYNFLLWCMLIPAALVFLIYLVRGLHPFGDGCVLVLDLNGQYVWFFEALRNFVRGDAELLYSFSRALGGEFLGIYAYYLASPLSFLVCLFPTDRMLEALLCLFLLKTALCGATFGYYMHKTMKTQNKLCIILFASFYALSSYALVQQHNTMWIDAVMWLPLITLGIEQVIKYGKFKLYTVSLAVTLFSNYYIGYMVCIWCVLYAVLFYLAHPKQVINPTGERLHLPRSVGRMLGYSVIAIGIASVIILGAYYSLNFGKTTFSDPSWEFATKFDLLDFLYKLLPGSYDTVRPEGLPFVYCGMLTLLLVPAYFLCRKYPIRQKIFSALLLFILFLCMSINVVDLVWHGFQTPNWLNYRYSFMFSFYLCVIACRAFEDFEHISLKVMLGTGGAIAVLCVVLQKYTNGEYIDPNDFACIYLSLALIFAYLGIFGYWRRTDKKKCARNGLIAIVLVELFVNGLLNICFLDMDVGYSRYSYYNDFLDKTRPIVQTVQESDPSFYRMEKTFFRKTNDNMALGIRGLSGSTSTLNKETIQLLNKMGYSSKSHWSKYLGGTPVSDSLLGLKYIISDNNVYQNYYEIYKEDPMNGYTAFYNPYALSIACGVHEDVLDFPLGFLTPEEEEAKREEEETSPAKNEEETEPSAMKKGIDAVKAQVNLWLGIKENRGDTYEDAYNSPFERLNAMVSAMLGEEETLRIFVPITDYEVTTSGLGAKRYYVGGEHGYHNAVEDVAGTLTYTVTVPKDGELFFYLPTNYPREVELDMTVNDGEADDWGTFNANETARIISLYQRKAGDKVQLDMTLTKGEIYILSAEQCFYYIDWAVFENAMARLAKDQIIIEEYTESSFKGNLKASTDNELILTTLAYDNGWEVYVDGERVETEKALGSLVSFRTGGKAGETHQIEMIYRPRAITVGLWISIGSLLVLIALFVLDHFFHFGCLDKRLKEPLLEGEQMTIDDALLLKTEELPPPTDADPQSDRKDE